MSESKDYKVINEKIVPKKKHPVKRAFYYVSLIIVGALIFGVVERFIFEYSGKLLLGIQNEKAKKQAVELTSTEETGKEETKKEVPVSQPKAVPTKTIVHKDIKVVEKKIDANLLDYADIMREFGKVAEEKNKSVVEVQSVVMGTDWFENPYEIMTSTAGFIIAKQDDYAYILTKYSKIKKGGNIKLSFHNGIVMDGILKNFNKGLDIAILTANFKNLSKEVKEEFVPVEIPSDEFINLGRPVMALGNPDGNMYSVLFGNVVNTKALEYQPDYVFDAFYTDISLVKEGFAMILDTKGKVLGISLGGKEGGSAKILATGRVVKLIENLINDEPIRYVGIVTKKFEGAEGKTGMTGGILVDSIVKDSPAEKAGFKEGDIVYALGDKKIERIEDFLDILEEKKVGEMVRFKIYRVSRNKGLEQDIEAIIGDSRGLK